MSPMLLLLLPLLLLVLQLLCTPICSFAWGLPAAWYALL